METSKPIGKSDDSSKAFIIKCLKGDKTYGFDIDSIYLLQNEKNIINGCNFFTKQNITIYKKDFMDLFANIKIDKNDFVYFDSPYSITTATYNEHNQWNKNDDLRLFQMCEKLHNKGIKFGMSNVFINKGIENILLKEFCKKNNFNVFSPNSFQYHAYGKANQKQQEVYICNYEISNKNHSFVKIQPYSI